MPKKLKLLIVVILAINEYPHEDLLINSNYKKMIQLNWIIGVLIAIIIFILTYKFWGKEGNLVDIISIDRDLTSITLADVA